MRAPFHSLITTFVLLSAAVPGARAQSTDQVLDQVRVLTPRSLRALVDTAEAGDTVAQFKVGLAYYYGYAVHAMPQQAARWFRRAAEAGSAAGQHMYGVQLRDGNGVEQNLDEAARLLRTAADRGYTEAQYDYGLMLFDGVGVEQDYPAAYALFSQAADHGAVEARTYAGVMLLNGLGVDRNPAAGRDELLQAAKAGSAMAQANIGALYANGVGVEQDPSEALVWFFMAQASGFDGADQFITDLTQSMSESQIADLKQQAQQRSHQFLAEASGGPGAAGAARVDNAESAAALQSIGDWLAAQLPELGTFTLTVRQDVARARVQDETNATVRASATISDVSLATCRLQFSEVIGLGDPIRIEWTVNLDKVDPERLRVEEWELPQGWRPVSGQVYSVYLQPLQTVAAQQTAIIGQEVNELPNFTLVLQIPFMDHSSADAVRAKLAEAVGVCGGK